MRYVLGTRTVWASPSGGKHRLKGVVNNKHFFVSHITGLIALKQLCQSQ